jgi:dimethylamine/trimethylamine dehydrogenase
MVEGKEVPGERVLVLDNDGYFMGVSLAEKLAMEAKKVTMMTPMGHFMPYMHFTLEAPNMHRRLHSLGVEMVTYHLPTRIEQGRVVASHVYDTEGKEHEWECDAVVLVSARLSDEALYRELKDVIGMDALRAEGIKGLYRIGDCVAPKLLSEVVFDGHRLAREIDSENPEVPKPFIRERRVIEREVALV